MIHANGVLLDLEDQERLEQQHRLRERARDLVRMEQHARAALLLQRERGALEGGFSTQRSHPVRHPGADLQAVEARSTRLVRGRAPLRVRLALGDGVAVDVEDERLPRERPIARVG